MRKGIDVGFSTTSTHLNLRVILIVKFMVKKILDKNENKNINKWFSISF